MDESEVKQIIMDAEVSQGCKCNQMEKEFMILKGSIKKLILDIREQMNASENPFSNIQMLQMPPPAPVIKEDPIEFELPNEEEEAKAAEDKAKADAARQAEKEKTMAQEKKAGNNTGCPYAPKASEVHNYCPLSANTSIPDQGCPLAKRVETPNRSYETNAHYLELLTYLLQRIEQSRPDDRATRNAGLDRYSGGLARSGERHVCSACGRPVSPDYDAHHQGSSWPYPYPRYPQHPPQEHWPERQGARDMYHEASGQPAYDPRQYFYDHPEYEPAQYGYPYGYGYGAEAGEADPRYRPQNTGRHRDAISPPEYHYRGYDDRRYYGQEPYGYRQEPARDEYERDYYRPASGPRRVYRGPASLPEDRYYGPAPDEQRGPVRYRPVQRRRQEPYPVSRGYDSVEDEFEMTEPLPEIDLLPDEPEQEEEPLRIRKRARNVRVAPEPVRPEVMEQPNPRPRRSRAVKHRD